MYMKIDSAGSEIGHLITNITYVVIKCQNSLHVQLLIFIQILQKYKRRNIRRSSFQIQITHPAIPGHTWLCTMVGKAGILSLYTVNHSDISQSGICEVSGFMFVEEDMLDSCFLEEACVPPGPPSYGGSCCLVGGS